MAAAPAPAAPSLPAEGDGVDGGVLRISRVVERCGVLGPGTRFVVWVQGCSLGCRGCLARETWEGDGGRAVAVAELAERVLAVEGIGGITFSGGEPFQQPAALARLVDTLRAARPFSVMSYSGYTLGWLRRRGSPAQRALLDRLDLLVDGPYRPELHADLRWRGSSNQRVRYLTPLHAPLAGAEDRGAGLEVVVEDDGSLHWMGVPPVPGFREQFERRMHEQGISLDPEAPR